VKKDAGRRGTYLTVSKGVYRGRNKKWEEEQEK
jgi:hypothetical protein